MSKLSSLRMKSMHDLSKLCRRLILTFTFATRLSYSQQQCRVPCVTSRYHVLLLTLPLRASSDTPHTPSFSLETTLINHKTSLIVARRSPRRCSRSTKFDVCYRWGQKVPTKDFCVCVCHIAMFLGNF